MNPNPIRIALAQCAIINNDVASNLAKMIATLADTAGKADLIVFPETITTGFAPDSSDFAIAWHQSEVFLTLVARSKEYGIGIAGSMLVREQDKCANRFFLFDGDEVQWQDKRHLFSLGGEPNMVIPTQERRVLLFRGWRIMPVICYDLRFPVWCRCRDNDYDMIIAVANWPKGRREVWQTLLKARAMENLAYCIGVNRIGEDAQGLSYTGDSILLNPRGEAVVACTPREEEVSIGVADYTPLADLRRKFPVWQDADDFTLHL